MNLINFEKTIAKYRYMERRRRLEDNNNAQVGFSGSLETSSIE